jgi:enamine deaminase RidA (YjgF/YER057c/UK114 family)
MSDPTRSRELIVNEDAAPGAPTTAVRAGDLVFIGQSPTPGAEGREADARTQAQNAFAALAQLLETAGGDPGDVVDVVTLHSDSRTIDAVLEVGREALGPDFPAWTPVACSAQRVPGRTVALSAVAHLGDEPKQCITPDTIKWWRELPASAGCRKGDLLFVAGQYGSDADGNVNTPGDHAGQARNALNRIAEICGLAGGRLDDVIDLLSFHQDPRWIAAVESVYLGEFFDPDDPEPPAWTAVGMPGLLRLGMLGQYRAIADLRAVTEGGTVLATTAAPPRDANGSVAHRGDPEAQARAGFELIAEGLAARGGSLRDVVQLVSFHLDPGALEAAERVARELFGDDSELAWTAAGMTGARHEGQLHAFHALAIP